MESFCKDAWQTAHRTQLQRNARHAVCHLSRYFYGFCRTDGVMTLLWHGADVPQLKVHLYFGTLARKIASQTRLVGSARLRDTLHMARYTAYPEIIIKSEPIWVSYREKLKLSSLLVFQIDSGLNYIVKFQYECSAWAQPSRRHFELCSESALKAF